MFRTLAAVVVSIGLAHAVSAATFAQSVDAGGAATVLQILDPATLDVRAGSTTERIRLIGLDVAQTVPGQPPACFARAAVARAHELVDGTSVSVELDPQRSGLDPLGRQPAYIRLADGRDLAEVLLREGLVRADTSGQPFSQSASFMAAQDAASAEGIGVWQDGACTTPAPLPPAVGAFVGSMLDETQHASTALDILHEQALVAEGYSPALSQTAWTQNTGAALGVVRTTGLLLQNSTSVASTDGPLAARLAALGQDLVAGADLYGAGIGNQDTAQVSDADGQLQTTAEALHQAFQELNALAQTYGLGD
jgi:micrococcal nuclease